MDSAKLILTESVRPPELLGQLETSSLNSASEEKKKQIAKDFESVLLNKLLAEMQNTIGDWGFEKNGPFKQVQGMFNLFLARDVANNGGIGLWKDIYGFLTNADHTNTTNKSLDADI
jgi:Rod binding domain-containing protein